ncbi:hypothetical protein H2200_012965 [Cladophialophora chaetospira]|uniref:Cep57 centrosome microtubule-binding domain-containing protein n=1 Tax=Cladophialophora chaetospira TaxID=386627 RepID=A0AA38WWH7_9EURO|nr:hypothetical protein H2200_012965 [Cladophialophora chaetospira]
MAPSRFDHGTLNTNYSSIHSHEAFVGEYQVMYTPGASPPLNRVKKSTRFSKPASSRSQPSQSFMLPNNIPNTSVIMPDQGQLPNVNIHYSVPADEKQIVASLRTLQRDLNEAIQTINSITRERDEALLELRLLRAASKKQTTPAKTNRAASRVEEELFDISRSMTPEEVPVRRTSFKEKTTDTKGPKTTISDEARVLSSVNLNRLPISPVSERRITGKVDANARSKIQSYQKPAVNDTDNSIVEDPTAASNTSRRRRRASLDDNMTSAYILPDITVNQPAKSAKAQVSTEARHVLHGHGDPEHIENCTVCQRLTAPTRRTKQLPRNTRGASAPVQQQLARNVRAASAPAESKPDFTAQLTHLMKEAHLEETTIRPKIHPWLALANVKKLLTDQFEAAKRKHALAWETYDAIEAPMSSKKHAAASEALFHWSTKMEECRINLDQLRDVEEGMREEESVL